MSKIREQLVRTYASHHGRVSREESGRFHPAARWLAGLERTFGHLIAGLPAGSHILDLGCGSGSVLYWLTRHPGLVAVGADPSVSQIEIAQSRLPDLEIHRQDGVAFLQRSRDRFAGIFCLDVLEHVPHIDDYLVWFEAVRAALAPGGFFCCRVPNAANLTSNYTRYMDLTHERIFTSTSIVQLLEAGGLARVEIVPIQAADWRGRTRRRIEHLGHQLVFRLCGRGLERVFTSNVCAVGFNS